MKYKIWVLIFLFLLVSGCKKQAEEILIKPEEIFFNLQDTVEVYSEATLNELILETNAVVTSEDYEISTDKLGLQKYKINYEYDKKKYAYEYEINIIDTVAPFIFGGTSLTWVKGDSGNICDLVSYGDNHDSKALCRIEGDYDSAKVGTYELKMIVTDSSGNETTKDIKLNIVEKITPCETCNNTKRLDFSEVKSKYQGDNIEYGIDVSSWQEQIDFVAVKAAGISFVMIRIGFQKSDGEIKMDTYFKENLAGAKAAGLKVGIYLYTDAKETADVIKQVSWIINELNGEKLELPIAFDWENWSSFNKYNLSFYELNNLANVFIDTVKAHEYEACLYSSKYYLENIWQSAKANQVWLAHYTEQTSYQGDYFMWQLSNVGRIPGIAGAVDFNILYNN